MTWAVVTGATARGGEAIARALHGAGIDVVIHHSERSRDRAMLLRDELRANGADAMTWEADLAQPVIVPPWVTQLDPAYCVCNASVYQPSEVGDSARAQLDLAVHLHANVAILTALQGTLRSVVAVTDVHVERPAGGFVWYTISKAALQSLLLNLAIEWAPRIRCNVVAPGTLPFPASWDDRAKMDTIGQSIPLGRVGDFGDLAGAVRYLLLEANYVTGQVLVVDGGRSRWLPG
ncbi:SDR family oxidoreductase [Variovorax rhizosphaerae]|uniref:SDR family oxidoreductase n=1 Tax=Variovorax rhizosphaerae TaxID=1836200 RepID=A0ABU8WXN7_9BURK